MLDAVIKETDKKIAKKVGLVSVTNPEAMKDAYNLKAEEIIELLEQGLLPEIKDFLEEEEGLSTAQKLAWLQDISNSFDGTKKNASLKIEHSMAKGEAVIAEVQRTVEREINAQRQKE